MFGVSTPTFVTLDVIANAQLQMESVKNAQILHFLNLHRSHALYPAMQSLWTKTQSSLFRVPLTSAGVPICWARARRCSTRCGLNG